MDTKIVALIGNAKRHIYFADSINDSYPLAGIVVEKKYSAKNRFLSLLKRSHYNPLRLSGKLYYKIKLRKIDKRYEKAENDILLGGNAYIKLRGVCPVLYTDDINSDPVKMFIKKIGPSLLLVSGTSLIKRDIIGTMPPNTIINMHTGLSPYYRGGPCTFWCLYNEEPEFLGVTIHFLTQGIDSGDIIFSRRMTDIEPGDNEATLDCKIIRLGTQLMLEAVKGSINSLLKSTPQWEKGKIFNLRDL
ncbi:MAG: hypothetical protein A2Z72_02935, partial [Omnitrophica bacterium RBG_13_46_9]